MKKLNILYLEDNLILRQHFEYFGRGNHEIESTDDPALALSWIKENDFNFDLIVTDCNLGRDKMNGLQFAQKAHKLTAVPIVMVTAGNVRDLDLWETGIVQVLTKPIVRRDFDEIIGLVAV